MYANGQISTGYGLGVSVGGGGLVDDGATVGGGVSVGLKVGLLVGEGV